MHFRFLLKDMLLHVFACKFFVVIFKMYIYCTFTVVAVNFQVYVYDVSDLRW